MKLYSRPAVLSIAGFDPSAGAGIAADIKTFESLKTKGLAVATCITYQHEDQFFGFEPLDNKIIFNQLTPLLQRYQPAWVKIGMTASFEQLNAIVSFLKKHNENINIIWDPVFRPTFGSDVWPEIKLDLNRLKQFYLITPNLEEVKLLSGENGIDGAKLLSQHTRVLLKGGHAEGENKGRDFLVVDGGGKVYPFKPKKIRGYEKHGTGCVLSSAITAHLARKFPLIKAVLRSRDYLARFMDTTIDRWGYHKL
ncbi:MAG: hydroxymethylpyrimidine/phosphomethylpyrimidine kinase [Vicingaceae bacterium]|nr:MAG: hydroxymethylpyrimidine/phosphomethylpyrimidine kinase [Bacteroidia bacterium]GIV42769.1 MAG: hydroxymethylpyrimidine/phosphomethylpyrimidine kinase [Vicingaceae bacterium]